jgi:hypothetical protein
VTARRALSAVAVTAVALLATSTMGSALSAEGRGIDAGTDPDGATVHVVDGSVSAGSASGSGGGCVRRYVPTDLLVYKFHFELPEAPLAIPAAPSLLHQAFDVYCGNTYLTTVWAIPSAAAAVIGAQTARELLARVEFPPVTIAASPARGLTGLDSWFWIDGTDGAPMTLSRTDFGISVDLEVRLVGVAWDFGDGTHVDAGLGKQYPARSDVTHTFESKGSRTVSAAFRFAARYRVDGAEWIDLGAVPRSTTAAYDVVEVRSLLVR